MNSAAQKAAYAAEQGAAALRRQVIDKARREGCKCGDDEIVARMDKGGSHHFTCPKYVSSWERRP